jgi:hypothetical protein
LVPYVCKISRQEHNFFLRSKIELAAERRVFLRHIGHALLLLPPLHGPVAAVRILARVELAMTKPIFHSEGGPQADKKGSTNGRTKGCRSMFPCLPARLPACLHACLHPAATKSE